MDNTNAQPGAGAAPATNNTTPASSTPASSTPTSSTPASSTPVAPSSAPKFDKKRLIIIGCTILGLIILSVVMTSVSKSSANKRLNKTIEICEEHGMYSSECKQAQEDNDVTCILNKCEATYHKFLFF